jgi:hypothetical protein
MTRISRLAVSLLDEIRKVLSKEKYAIEAIS